MPLSPVISTGSAVAAARPIALKTARIAVLDSLSTRSTASLRLLPQTEAEEARLSSLADAFGKMGDQLREGVEAVQQRVETADRVRVGDRLTELDDRRLRLGGWQVGATYALFQQLHLGGQLVVLAMEVGQGLFRLTGLPGPDGPFSLSRTYVDGAVVVYPAPRVGAHRVLPHSNQPFGTYRPLYVLRQL